MWFTATLHLYLAFQSNFYEQGMKAMQEQRYTAAIESFNNAIAAEPKDFTLHFNLALAYSLLGRDAEGIQEYKKCLELNPDLHQANLNVGMLLIRQKEPAEAISYLKTAVTQKPKEFRPNYYLAEAYSRTGDYANATQLYRAALEADPKSAAAEAGLGFAIAKEGRLAEAEPHYRKAAELDPKYHSSLLELAQMFEDREQFDDAVALYKQFPEDAAARERIGAIEIKQGKAAEAVTSLEAAVAQSPTVPNRAALATAYIKNKQPTKAFPIIRDLLQVSPNDYELRMVYARMLRDDRKFPEASQEFLRATQIKPDSAEAWSELATILVISDNYGGALAALDKVASLHAEKPGHVYLRAIVLDKIHQLKPALESYRQFLSLSHGESPNEEFKARQRARIIQQELNRR